MSCIAKSPAPASITSPHSANLQLQQLYIPVHGMACAVSYIYQRTCRETLSGLFPDVPSEFLSDKTLPCIFWIQLFGPSPPASKNYIQADIKGIAASLKALKTINRLRLANGENLNWMIQSPVYKDIQIGSVKFCDATSIGKESMSNTRYDPTIQRISENARALPLFVHSHRPRVNIIDTDRISSDATFLRSDQTQGLCDR
jgi:hypothetical protein